jgi:hypothetical protein
MDILKMSKIENLKYFLEKVGVLEGSYVNAHKTEKITQKVLP